MAMVVWVVQGEEEVMEVTEDLPNMTAMDG